MTAQLDAGEIHPITVSLDESFTDITCAVCGALERTSGPGHGAQHALVTGHTVTERHVTVSTIRENVLGGAG